MSYFVFDGQKIGNLTTGDTGWEADVFPAQIDAAPARQFEVYEPAGRIGNIIIDNQRYADVEHSYWVVVRTNADATYHEIAGFLQSRTGYCRLSDSFHTDEYYQAYVSEEIEPIFDRNRATVKFYVTFTRKPQRYLTSGETSVVTSTAQEDTGHFTNPTPFDAMPLVKWRVGQYYTGVVPIIYIYRDYTGIAGQLMYTIGIKSTWLDPGALVTIDFEAYSAFKGVGEQYDWGNRNINKDLFISYGSSSTPRDFFTLPGNTKLHFKVPAGIDDLQFIPRWWRL